MFYNFNNATVKPKGSSNDSELKFSYGVKADVGYDITNRLAAFVTFGYQEMRFTSNIADSATLESHIYGVGAKYSVTDNVDLGLAYEYVNYNRSDVDNSFNPEVVKVGVAYKF